MFLYLSKCESMWLIDSLYVKHLYNRLERWMKVSELDMFLNNFHLYYELLLEAKFGDIRAASGEWMDALLF